MHKIAYNEGARNINPNIFSILEGTKPRDCILLNLTALHWKVESAGGLAKSLLFFTSELRHLTIEVGSDITQEELASFLTEASARTRLTTLSITSASRLPNQLPRLLQQQTTLDKVALLAPGALAPSIGRWLSSLSCLNSLQLDVGDRSDGVIASFFTGVPTSGRSSPGIATPDLVMTPMSGADSTILVEFLRDQSFRQLRHLYLNGDVSSASNFLGRISAPLTNIELALNEPEDAKAWYPLWSTVSRQFKDTLRTLVVSPSNVSRFTELVRSTSRGENVSRRLSFDGMSRLPRLFRFEFDLPESKLFFDHDIQTLATSCPNLEIVKICPLSRWPMLFGPPKATLAGLALLTGNCRRLHTVHMPVHAFRTDNLSLFDVATSSRSLGWLHVGHSWIEDPLGVSILLSHLAPHLSNLKVFHEKNRPGYVEAHSIGWQRVAEILPQLQQVRLQERSQRSYTAQYTSSVTLKPPPSPSQFSTPMLTKMVSRAVQVKPAVNEFGTQTKVNVRHKNISTKPVPDEMHSVAVEAKPALSDESISAYPSQRDASIEVQPQMVSTLIETDEIPAKQLTDASTSVDENDVQLVLHNADRASGQGATAWLS